MAEHSFGAGGSCVYCGVSEAIMKANNAANECPKHPASPAQPRSSFVSGVNLDFRDRIAEIQKAEGRFVATPDK